MAGADILDIVIDELHHKKKPYAIILLNIDKNSEVGFHYTILSFGLTIRL